MCHVSIDRLVILPIDENVLIGYLRRTVLGPQFLGGLVKVVINQFSPGTSLHQIYVAGCQNLGLQWLRESSGEYTNLAPQILDRTLRKCQLLGAIKYVLQGQILIYHELVQVSHYLGIRIYPGSVM